MKTPREILLNKHQAAKLKLDAIRQTAVAAVADRRPSSSTTRATIFETLWNELVLPSRRIWTGLAATWVLIAIAHIPLRDHSSNGSSASPQVVISLPQQEKLLAELSGPAAPAVSEPPKPYVPRPSSLRPFTIITT
jgi:hypothetical protein